MIKTHIPIIIVNQPIPSHNKSSELSLGKLVEILHSFSDSIVVIGGNFSKKFCCFKDVLYQQIPFDHQEVGFISKILRNIFDQVRLSLLLLRNTRTKRPSVVFFWIANILLLPVLVAKLLGLKVVVFHFSPAGTTLRKNPHKFMRWMALFVDIVQKVNENLAHFVGVESKHVIISSNLIRLRKKIAILNLFVDTKVFFYKKLFSERKIDVGYIGRFSADKNIINFLEACEYINKTNALQIAVAGGGPQEEKVKDYINRPNLNRMTNFLGWIPSNKMPALLNSLKIIILPSLNEGLPNIVLEAMACGTSVLATPVGGIPDIIKDGHTGYLLPDTSPQSIAEGIQRALNDPNLEKVSSNAQQFIIENYTREAAIARMRAFIEKHIESR